MTSTVAAAPPPGFILPVGGADVAQPPGWTAADTERLRQVIGLTTVAGTAVRARVRLPARAASELTVAAIGGCNLVEHLLPSQWWLRPIEAAALHAWARL